LDARFNIQGVCQSLGIGIIIPGCKMEMLYLEPPSHAERFHLQIPCLNPTNGRFFPREAIVFHGSADLKSPARDFFKAWLDMFHHFSRDPAMVQTQHLPAALCCAFQPISPSTVLAAWK